MGTVYDGRINFYMFGQRSQKKKIPTCLPKFFLACYANIIFFGLSLMHVMYFIFGYQIVIIIQTLLCWIKENNRDEQAIQTVSKHLVLNSSESNFKISIIASYFIAGDNINVSILCMKGYIITRSKFQVQFNRLEAFGCIVQFHTEVAYTC